MAVRLGELLINKNLLTQAQLEEALQAQVIFGGKLGTVLIEMGLITEDYLAEILAQLLAIPCVKPGQLQSIPEDVIKIISPSLAEKNMAVPVAVKGKKLTLAMADPRNLKAIDDISFRTGYIIQPVLALEVRLVFALEKYYDVKRTMRYIAPPKQVRDELNQLSLKARQGKLTIPDIQGATITISSLGGIGGTGFTPIVNGPQVAILGLSRSYQKPVWDGEKFIPRLTMPFSVSYDHRVVDGAEAARFCRALARQIEDLRRTLL